MVPRDFPNRRFFRRHKNFFTIMRYLKLSALVLCSLLAALLLLEIGCSIFYRTQNDHFIYFRPKGAQNESKLPGITEEQLKITNTLNPYLGFMEVERLNKFVIYKWTPDPETGKDIMSQTIDYAPYKKQNENELLFVFLGGSVAKLTLQDETPSVLGGAAIVDKLRTDEFFKDKTLVFVSHGQGAYKQPQQLIILILGILLDQDFDFVVNIDGFNDLTLSLDNIEKKFPYYFPSAMIMQPLLNMLEPMQNSYEFSLHAIEIFELRKSMFSLDQRMRHTSSALAYYIYKMQYQSLVLKLSEKEQAIAEQSLRNDLLFVQEDLNKMQGPEKEYYARIERIWARSSRMIYDICQARGATYLHVIQPNQYYDLGKREFSPEEAKIALLPLEDHPFRKGVVNGYPMILETGTIMAAQGFPIYNATQIFWEVKEPVYMDSCCHLNEQGQKIFANYLADIIVKANRPAGNK